MSNEPLTESRTVRFILDVSADPKVDPEWLAEMLLDYLCADEINGLPVAIRSVDGVEPTNA